MLAVQGVEFHSFTILPLWLIWAATDVWLIQAAPTTQRFRGKAAGMATVRFTRLPPPKALMVEPQPG